MRAEELVDTLPNSPWRESLLALAMLSAVWLAMGLALGLFLSLPGWRATDWYPLVEAVILISAAGTGLVWLGSAPLSRRWLGVRQIHRPANDAELRLLLTARELARRAGLPQLRVGIVDTPACNAFTLGFGRGSACLAVGRELLERLDDTELEAVLAHEVAHVLNGDLRTLTWINGAVNMVTVQPARLVGWLVDRLLLRRSQPGIGYYTTLAVTQLTWGWLASLLSGWFSRRREFEADRTASHLVGRDNMRAALQQLHRLETERIWTCPEWLVAFGVTPDGFLRAQRLLNTHPGLEERIERLAVPA